MSFVGFTQRLISLCVAVLVLASAPLSAEVVWVKVSWDPTSCPGSCYPVLERRLNAIKGVADAHYNFVEGEATLRWKPGYQYEDRLIKTAVAWVGIAIEDIAIKIRGSIFHGEKQVYVASLGDETKLPLISAPKPEQGRYVIRKGEGAHKLDSKERERLLQAEENFELITIEGRIFQPYRPPVRLMIDRVSYPTPL